MSMKLFRAEYMESLQNEIYYNDCDVDGEHAQRIDQV